MRLGWCKVRVEDFDEQDACEFVANVQLFDHKQYKKRVLRGRVLAVKKFAKALERGGRSRMRAFIAKARSKKAALAK